MKTMGEHKNLKSFSEDFIIAGPRSHIIYFLNLFKNVFNLEDNSLRAKQLLHEGKHIVILCKNEGTNKKFPVIQILTREWWNYYHNNRQPRVNKSKIKTFNGWKQKDLIIKRFIVENLETLIPE